MSNLIDRFQEQFTSLEEIKRTTFSSEDTTQGKPAMVTLVPYPDVPQDQIDAIAAIGLKMLDKALTPGVKASVEHPYDIYENDDDEIHSRVVEDEWVIKFRWQASLHGQPPATRSNGYMITDKGLPDPTNSDHIESDLGL